MEHTTSPRIALVTQDTVHVGGVIRLVRYFYNRCEALGYQPEVLHYASFKKRPHLSVSLANIPKSKLSQSIGSEKYQFEGMRARAIGAYFPEWEPNRISLNHRWKRELAEFDGFFLITGSAHVGLPLVKARVPFSAWISATVADDRRARLNEATSLEERLEKLSLGAIHRAEKIVLRKAERVLAVSDDTKEGLLELLPTLAVDVFPFPINTEFFSPGERSYDLVKPRIVFVGRAADPRKNISLFFEAIRKLKANESFLPLSITVVSSLELSNEIRSKYEDVIPHVEFVSRISDEHLVHIYRSATALVVTSDQEGLHIGALEAMACGTPVIATRCGGPEMFINESCGFLTSFSAEEIAERIAAIAKNEELFERMGRTSCEVVQRRFSEAVWNEKFDALIQTQVAARPSLVKG